MELPDFELGPLEMEEVAASEPATAPASARVRVDGEDYLLRLAKGRTGYTVIFFRLDVQEAPILRFDLRSDSVRKIREVLLRGDEPLPSLFEEVSLSLWEEELPPLVRDPLQNNQWERLLAFPEELLPSPVKPTPMNLRLHKAGGSWMLAQEKQHLQGHVHQFNWPSFSSWKHDVVIRTPDAQMVERIQSLLFNPDSEAVFAAYWAQMNWDEQVRSVLKFENGDQDELAQVLSRATSLCAPLLKEQWPDGWDVHLQRSGSGSGRERKHWGYILAFQNAVVQEENIPVELHRWLDVLHRYFVPAYDVNVERFPIIKNILRGDGFYFSVSIPAPSQHERLEARHNLREWLQGKVAPEEIPALLGEA